MLLLLSLVFAACQSGGGIVENFDYESGLTLVTGEAPVVFARSRAQFSRSARDYLYLGPVEVNERGLRHYYLWLGMGSTIDRQFLALEASQPTVLIFELDGVPVEFELRSWDDREPRLAGRRLYRTAVAPAAVLAARVTRDQLALIAAAGIDSIRIATEDMATIEYLLWDGALSWPAFSNHTGIR